MPHLNVRDEDHNTRKKRLANLARGPGTFVYDGSLEDVHSFPTPLLTGSNEVQLNDEGLPVVDGSGRPVYKPAGRPVVDFSGKIVLGGVPRIERKKRDTVEVRGVSFPAGKAVFVESAALALKLRGMPGFEEVATDAEGVAAVEAKKRGRPAKKSEGSAE